MNQAAAQSDSAEPVKNRDAAHSHRDLIKPDSRLIGLIAGWLLAAFIIRLAPPLQDYFNTWLWLGALLALIGLYDAWSLLRDKPAANLKRQVQRNWPVGAAVQVHLQLSHASQRPLPAVLHDLYPDFVDAQGLPQKVLLTPGEEIQLAWRATARKRGEFNLSDCHLAWLSPLKLWWRRTTLVSEAPIRVYPNFNLVVRYGQLAGDRRLDEMGIHLAQRRGTGSEFHQLRDYRDGDSLRQIDWHATARMRKLIAKDYQEERDQRVVFLLDCSRRMRAHDGDLGHFDQCLNAMLLLAHVAIRQGDEVALQTMAEPSGQERRLPPGRGQRQFATLLESIFDLEAGPGYPDFLTATRMLMEQHVRRSLVVVLTNLRDEDHDELDPALTRIRQRHLVVLADLREQIADLGSPASKEPLPTDHDQALLHAGAAMYRERRKAATRHLGQRGIIHLDISPEQLPAALVSQYRKLKASGAL